MSTWEDYDWCGFCGCNPVYGPGLCSSCQADEDFANCAFCHGTDCTGECEDDGEWAAATRASLTPPKEPVSGSPGDGGKTP